MIYICSVLISKRTRLWYEYTRHDEIRKAYRAHQDGKLGRTPTSRWILLRIRPLVDVEHTCEMASKQEISIFTLRLLHPLPRVLERAKDPCGTLAQSHPHLHRHLRFVSEGSTWVPY